MWSYLLIGLLTLLAAPSIADAQGTDPASAQALFDQARELMKSQRFDEACPRLRESQRLDPGIGTQFHLAQCLEGQGKIASAWAAFLEVVSMAAGAGQADRGRLAQQRAQRLEGRLPRLTIVVPPDARVSELQVTRNGQMVGEVQWDSPIPVDPGKYVVRASAPYYREFTVEATVEGARTTEVVVPALELERAVPMLALAPAAPHVGAALGKGPAIAEPAPSPAISASTAVAPSEPAEAHRGRAIRVAASLMTGLAVAGLASGSAFGLVARSRNDSSKDSCFGAHEDLCDARGVSLRNGAFSMARASTALFLAGGVLGAGAITLWVVELRRRRADSLSSASRLRARLSMSSVALQGSF